MELEALTISNFRSIRGSFTIPLDAPVVLIHGLNGAGKTSVLAAMELALTGQFAGSVPAQPGIFVHRGAKQATIHLKTTGEETSGTLSSKGVKLAPLLKDAEARFYSERCYLTQARLGRLLEIYQSAEGRSDTPLTRFIKDLLRLDRLDALVDGLQAVGDKRNLRKLVPRYAEVERELTRSQRRAEELRTSLAARAAQRLGILETLRENASSLGLSLPEKDGQVDLAALPVLLADDGLLETQLTALIGARRELSSAHRRLQKDGSPDAARAISQAESAATTAQQAADAWRGETGTALEGILDDLRQLLPELPSVASSGPSEAFDTAVSRVSAEVTRCTTNLSKDDMDRSSLEALAERAALGGARVAATDSQIEAIGSSGDLQSLAQALSELVAHVHDDNCPVCGRDYSEVSNRPLLAALTSRIADLGESATQLQALIVARTEATADLRTIENQQAQTTARLLPEVERLALQRRSAGLSQHLARLRAIEAQVARGAELLRSATQTASTLARANEANRAASEVGVVVSDIATSLGFDPPATGSVQQNLDAVRGQVDARIAALEARVAHLAQTRDCATQLATLDASIAEESAAADETTERNDALKSALDTAERRREIAKVVSNRAVTVRTSIAREVFNDSLNKLWRELFIRLAPGEPYVPAFRLPDGPGTGVIAELQTVHRDGEAAGSPQAMLSAGNLNTAALTLFFALHLSAVPQLPWLILDDPVQSMDEMHVAQLAALLRTITRQHQRQVILAIHERPLFDYLALELSPGRPNDRLITVEISRERGGDTVARSAYFTFEEDRAVPAA